MEIFWIGNTEIKVSETFVRNNLDLLGELGQLSGITGSRTINYMENLKIGAKGFAHPLESDIEKFIRKISGLNSYYRRIDKSFQLRYGKMLKLGPSGILYIQFASTAVLLANSILKSNTPFFIQIHGVDISAMLKIEEYKSRLLRVANSSNCKGVIGNSHHLKRLAVLAGVEHDKCLVVRNAISGNRINRDHAIPKTKHPSFVHLGRLTEKKNPIATLEAFRIVQAKCPKASMTFIGDGPQRSELEKRIKCYGLAGAVTLVGACNHEEAMKIIQRHWVFVQHSVTSILGDQEGFPNSGAEAALLQMPVVATYHNGFPEQVIDGRTGYLVPEFNFEMMADRMLKLISDADLRTDFGDAGRKHILQLCNPITRSVALREIFSKVN